MASEELWQAGAMGSSGAQPGLENGVRAVSFWQPHNVLFLMWIIQNTHDNTVT